ncbi:MAG: truB, partial [Phycisphaerales bacterium]|nr:truB [Phycisphaerales bacterium]
MKVSGRRAYDIARKGGEVKLEPRPVRVYSIDLLGYEWPFVRVRIDCGRGTYIRAIARDLGAALNIGGHLTELRRTRIGDFNIAQAITLETLTAEGVAKHLQPIAPTH